MGFFLQLLIGIVLTVVSYLLMPKPKAPKTEITEAENPTAEAGIPMPVLFGTIETRAPNCIWFGDKYYKKSKVKS